MATHGVLSRAGVAVLILTAMTSAPVSAEWLRLRSPHFVVVGDSSERELRRVVERVEAFREGLVRALPNATVAMPVPMTIIVFGSESGFTPFKPIVDGQPMERVGGYFMGGEDAHFIAMTLAQGESAYPTVLHEYTHALLAETLPSAPMWFNEGLAEIYSTYTVRANRRSAVVGAAPEHHVRELQKGPLLPLEQLMGADAHSPLYSRGEHRGMFYAQAWALTHYLLLGNPNRRGQVGEYLSLLDQGRSVPEAIRQAFRIEPSKLEAELRDYSRLFSLNGFDVALDPGRQGRVVMRAERISAAEAATYTVELLARSDRVEEARRVIDELLRANPDLPRGWAALGRLHIRAGRVEEGLPILRRAVAGAPSDAAAAATYARALVEELRAKGMQAAADDREGLDRVGRALDVAAALDPDDAYVTAMQGYVALLEGGRLERARELLEGAVRRAPARQDYQLLLAQVFIEQREWTAAQAILGPLIAHGRELRVKDQARTLLARAAEDAGASNSATREMITLRTPEPGVARALGQLERIECRDDVVLLHVRTGERALELRTTRLDDVDFINYRDEPIAPVGCRGLSEVLPVVATFRHADSPQAVAIEFVPPGFTMP